ncbi:MAG: hypothetical protein GC189_10280 [Alphaproteobacteria bacterium]|nr:hypothetical protein [Alphaproteobacteria bacterium]
MDTHTLDESGRTEEEDLFEMANLYPRDTGLPMTVWVSPKGRARHDARVKVCRTHGDRMNADDTAVVAVRPAPALLHGELSAKDEAAVLAWVQLNADALIGYWDGDISTVEFVQRMQRV